MIVKRKKKRRVEIEKEINALEEKIAKFKEELDQAKKDEEKCIQEQTEANSQYINSDEILNID